MAGGVVLGLLMLPGIIAIAQDTTPEMPPTADSTFVYGDPLPDAPELAPRGAYQVGVRTLQVTNPDQIDVLRRLGGEADARYDRTLTLEVWYPAVIPADQTALTEYQDVLPASVAEAAVPFSFAGRALRDAEPDLSGAAYPLIVVSHGYPGSRVQLSYLDENLASKGYVVVAIDHTESTFADTDAFQSTLYNRPLDIRFTIDQMTQMSADSADNESFLKGLADTDHIGLIGYSMGGYGSLNVVGAGYNAVLSGFVGPFASNLLAGNPDYIAAHDDRIKAVVALAPFGADLTVAGAPGLSFWDDEGLAGVEVPVLFIVGDQDDVAGYEKGVRRIFDGTINSDRYLLTFVNARHNVGGNPPPAAATSYENWERYSEPAWDKRRINNIVQHFATAFLGVQLQGQSDYQRYLAIATEPGADVPSGTAWVGFPVRAAVGLRLEHAAAAE